MKTLERIRAHQVRCADSVPTISDAFSRRSRDRKPIRTMDEWRDRRKAVNKGWVPGKSAWETANAWVGSGCPAVPADFRHLLESHDLTTGVVVDHGVVEHQTSLRYPRGPRNHDLALWGDSAKVFIGIESKANDGFEGTMQDQINEARAIRLRGKNTNLDLRTEWLSHCLMGVPLLSSDNGVDSSRQQERDARAEVLQLPYQLFAGVTGTLLEASKAEFGLAVFVVHQFRTCFTDDAEIGIDGKLFDRFVSLLIKRNPAFSIQVESAVPLQYGKLIGPIYLENRDCGERWTMPSGIPLLIGKLLTGGTGGLAT